MSDTWQHRRLAASRFLVFAGEVYYPCGGWDDFVAAFGDRDHAIEIAMKYHAKGNWVHVVDQNNFGPGAVIWCDGEATGK